MLINNRAEQFEAMGGRAMLVKVNKAFYDAVYAHPWMSQFFAKVDQTHIEEQQTNFMQSVLGGPSIYCGRTAPQAHPHMNIPDELFDIRKTLLTQALRDCHANELLALSWLKMDERFRKAIVKSSVAECEPRYSHDPILDFKKPV
jgi:hemoglobin